MAKIRIAYLNVTMPSPHSPERYVDLFRTVLRRRNAVDIRGDYRAMLGSVRVDQGLITGEIYKFFDLDLKENWFNTEKQKKAEDEELAQIKVPANLKPHLRTFDYVFFPRKHRIAFVSKDRNAALSPRQAEKLFSVLFAEDTVMARFGDISITVEPQREQLNRILRIPLLQKLRLEVTPPNPDDLESAEKAVMNRLENMHAKRMLVEYSAPRSKGLNVDDETKQLARIAQSNGKVEGEGVDAEGRKVELSTEEHPLTEEVFYDESVQPRLAALVDKATRTMQDL